MSWPSGLPRQDFRGQYRHEGQRDGRSPAATRRQSRARCLSLTLLAPGSEPFRYILMGDGAPLIKLLEPPFNPPHSPPPPSPLPATPPTPHTPSAPPPPL